MILLSRETTRKSQFQSIGMWTRGGSRTLRNNTVLPERRSGRLKLVSDRRKPPWHAGRDRLRAWAVSLAGIAVFLASPARPTEAASRRDRAETAYRRAVKMRAALEAKRPARRPFKDYSKLIRAFDLVYRTDPGYGQTPRALADEAEIYRQMGRVFANDRYYESAAATYQFLIDQYAGASVSRDAVFTLAEIYRVDLENPDEAAKAYTQFLTKYPYARDAPVAKLRLRELNRRLTARAAEQARAAEAGKPASAVQEAPGRVIVVDDVRYWEGPNYTRIVISLEDEAKYQAVRLSRPDRIVFDLPGTRVSHTLAGKAFPVGNGFLQQIRVAQYKPDVSRVVLDIEKIGDYTVFSLPNPFRLIIDIHGPHQLVATRSPVTPLAAGSAVAKSETAAPSNGTATGDASKPSNSAGDWQPFEAPAANPEQSAGQAAESVRSPASGRVKEDDLSRPAGAPPTYASNHASLPPTGVSDDVHGDAGAETTDAQPSAHTSLGSATLTRALGLKIARIVIDPGHGGHDTGTIGPEGLEEKEVVLNVALRLRKLIEQRMGSKVVMTRSDDTFIPLEERTAIANQRSADLFISIHANASRDPSARGIEVYYLNFTSDPNSLEVAARENATSQESVHQLQSLIKKIALSEKIEESSDFARQVDNSLASAETRNGITPPDRGLKKAPFVVLIGANMPSILAEISFLTNPRDERLLHQPQYRQQIAEGLYRGISRYVSNLGSLKIAQRTDSGLPVRRVSAHRAGTDPLPSTEPQDEP